MTNTVQLVPGLHYENPVRQAFVWSGVFLLGRELTHLIQGLASYIKTAGDLQKHSEAAYNTIASFNQVVGEVLLGQTAGIKAIETAAQKIPLDVLLTDAGTAVIAAVTWTALDHLWLTPKGPGG